MSAALLASCTSGGGSAAAVNTAASTPNSPPAQETREEIERCVNGGNNAVFVRARGNEIVASCVKSEYRRLGLGRDCCRGFLNGAGEGLVLPSLISILAVIVVIARRAVYLPPPAR